MKKEYHVFWGGNAWITEQVTFLNNMNEGPVQFVVNTKDGQFQVTLSAFDFITEKVSDIVIPTLA